jgi:hypothetical protein
MVGGSPRVLRPLPPLKLVAMILLNVALNTKNQLKTVTFVFAVSVVSQHHQGVCTNTGLLRIEIIIAVLLNLVLTPQLIRYLHCY